LAKYKSECKLTFSAGPILTGSSNAKQEVY